MRKSRLGVGIGFIFVAIVIVLILALCTTKVPAGYVAVQYKMNGGVMDEVLSQGFHITSPTIKTSLYTVGIEQSYLTSGSQGDSENDESFSACSKEGKDIKVDLTFTYRFEAENVTKVFTTFKGQSGKEVRDSFIKPNIISWTKEIIARYAISDILGEKRAEINVTLTDYLAEKFEPYGIAISNVSLINLEVDAETSTAINNKIKAQQDAETQRIQNQTNIDRADAEAKVKMTQAQAEADALLIAAKAEAEANRLVSESLTDTIIKEKTIEAWDGKLPTVMGSDGNIIDIGDISNSNIAE